MFSLGLVNQKSRPALSQPQAQPPVQTVMAASSITAPAPQVTVTPNSTAAPVSSTVPPTPSTVASTQENPAANPPKPVPVVEAVPPKPAPLRLQAVFFTPPKPLAIINGKRVHVGDSVRELQVVAIGSASAMLIGPSQTNFLTLE
jgi:hypothetical protein